MNRRLLEAELKKVGVSMQGWDPILGCDKCDRRWRPFTMVDDGPGCVIQADYWKCPSGCNAAVGVNSLIVSLTAKYYLINDIPGMIVAPEDLREFEQFVMSVDNTEVWNKD